MSMDKVFQETWVLPHSTASGRLVLPAWWRTASMASLSAGLALTKLWLTHLDTVRIHNAAMMQQLYDRSPDVPLLTVSNHYSCMDDPFMFAAALSWKQIFTPSKYRWGVAAHNVAYTTKRHAYGFSLARAMPIVRGAGIYQRSIDFCIDRLNEGCWVHIFPEGKVNMSKELLRLKWGVGRIVSECRKVPLVVPIWHCGFDSILPNHPPYIPRVREKATILFGSPITELSDTVDKLKQMRVQATEMRKAVTDRIQNELYTLKTRAEQLHFKEFGIRVSEDTTDSGEQILHNSDAAENESTKKLLQSVVNTKTIRPLTDANADPGAAGSLMGGPQPPFGGM